MALKQSIQDDMKAAMKGGDKERLATIRLILAAIKQREVDERIEMTDADILNVLDKMVKQRRESIAQYSKAGRNDLADAESAEITVIQAYLPEPLSETEIDEIVQTAMTETEAKTIADMGKVMALVKPKLQGRADLGLVSARIKSRLG
ncbi:MAG: GatB/YqeY domain-containing protein [Methylococcaceae bacterium]|nr:GatB/YqeY domain-containing protein [Methylococcaceae bacterium]